MTDDFVAILRDWGTRDLKSRIIETLLRDAADEIERSRAEVDLKGSRLDDALDEIERLRADNHQLEMQLAIAHEACGYNAERLHSLIDRLITGIYKLSIVGDAADMDALYATVREARRD